MHQQQQSAPSKFRKLKYSSHQAALVGRPLMTVLKKKQSRNQMELVRTQQPAGAQSPQIRERDGMLGPRYGTTHQQNEQYEKVGVLVSPPASKLKSKKQIFSEQLENSRPETEGAVLKANADVGGQAQQANARQHLPSRNGRQANRGSFIRQKAPIQLQDTNVVAHVPQSEEITQAQIYQQRTEARFSQPRRNIQRTPNISNATKATKAYMATLTGFGFNERSNPHRKFGSVGGAKPLQMYAQGPSDDLEQQVDRILSPDSAVVRFNKSIRKQKMIPRVPRIGARNKLEPLHQLVTGGTTYSFLKVDVSHEVSPHLQQAQNEVKMPQMEQVTVVPPRIEQIDFPAASMMKQVKPPKSNLDHYQNNDGPLDIKMQHNQLKTFATSQDPSKDLTHKTKRRIDNSNDDLPFTLSNQQPISSNTSQFEDYGLKPVKIKSRGVSKKEDSPQKMREKKQLSHVINIYGQQVMQRGSHLNNSRLKRINFVDDLGEIERSFHQQTLDSPLSPELRKQHLGSFSPHQAQKRKEQIANNPGIPKTSVMARDHRRHTLDRKTPDVVIIKGGGKVPKALGQPALRDGSDVRTYKSVKMHIKQVHKIHYDDKSSVDDWNRPVVKQKKEESPIPISKTNLDQLFLPMAINSGGQPKDGRNTTHARVGSHVDQTTLQHTSPNCRRTSVGKDPSSKQDNLLIDKSSRGHSNRGIPSQEKAIKKRNNGLNGASITDKELLVSNNSGLASKDSFSGSKMQSMSQSPMSNNKKSRRKTEGSSTKKDFVQKQVDNSQVLNFEELPAIERKGTAEELIAQQQYHQDEDKEIITQKNLILQSPCKRQKTQISGGNGNDATPYFKHDASGGTGSRRMPQQQCAVFESQGFFNGDGAAQQQDRSVSQESMMQGNTITSPPEGLRSHSEQKQYVSKNLKKVDMIKIEDIDRKRVTQTNTSINTGQILHQHLEQNFLVVKENDRQYKKKQKSTPCNDMMMQVSNQTSHDQLSHFNRESLRQSNINSFNYQPFKNESELEYSSVGDKTYTPFIEETDLPKKLTPAGSVCDQYPSSKRKVQKGNTTMLIVVDENQESNLRQNVDLASVGPTAGGRQRTTRGRSTKMNKSNYMQRSYNNNLHPKYQKPKRSSTRQHSMNLHCFNKTSIKDYEIQCLIGQGAFGIVQRATNKETGQKVAIKQYERSKLEKEPERVISLRKEINVLARLDHVGIMGFVDSIDAGHRVNLVVEYINGSNLYQYIRKLPESRIKDENEVKILFRKIVESVKYMHEQNVVHRDLKLENILLDRKTKQTKLIDFGFATVVSSITETKLPYSCGTPIYMCPEMAMKKEHLGWSSDVWALGVILYILLTGKMPFHAAYEDDLFRKISTCKYRWPTILTDTKNNLTDVSAGAKNLVRRIFNLDEKKRPTAEAILKDPWLKTRDQFEKKLHNPFPSANNLTDV